MHTTICGTPRPQQLVVLAKGKDFCKRSSRRDFILSLTAGICTSAIPSWAQAPSIPRIAFVQHGSSGPFSEAFRAGLRELGYIEGKNIIVEFRWTEGKIENAAALVDEMIGMRVKVIVGAGDPVINTLHNRNKAIPVVMANSQNPVGAGYAATLARPGGNMTGTTTISPELAGKRLELLRDTLPSMRRVAILWDRTADQEQLKSTEAAAKVLNITSQPVEMRKFDDVVAAFSTAQAARPDALVVLGSSGLFAERTYIALLSAKLGMPAIYSQSGYVEAGGLMSYGANFPEMYRRAATYVDKILKGARPAELPIERPTRFELVINIKTAKVLGVTIPQTILVRADRVIE